MRNLTYFVSDVHLGLRLPEAPERERQFVAFLNGIPAAQTEALYLLGDIWDFWYEYVDVVPKGYIRVFAALTALMDAGVKVYFVPGNHDQWTYGYFTELGMTCIAQQPFVVEIGGKTFCLAHGDMKGVGEPHYDRIQWAFHNRLFRTLFSALHPRLAFGWGKTWSRQSRSAKPVPQYQFKGKSEKLYHWCESYPVPVDYFVFGHYHCPVDLPVGKARLIVMSDWREPNWVVFDAAKGELTVNLP